MSEPAIRLRSSARTSTGQVRENNEDNIHLWARDSFILAVVADGMGGAAAGEEASRLAVESIKSGLALPNRSFDDDIGDATLSDELRRTIQLANNLIVEKAASSAEYRGMGTTVTLALVRDTHALFAHVGDSRAYLVSGEDERITQITSDHSFVEALLAAGHITHEQAEEHPMRNVLYRALGQAEDVDVDLYYRHLRIGDRLVLCSDGLTRHVKAEEIGRIAREHTNPDIVSQKLIDLANARGGEDNVSVIVISVEQGSTASGEPGRHAAMAEDDEQTLILKNRPFTREEALRQPTADTPTVDTPAPDDPPTASESHHRAAKMSAERLRDVAHLELTPEDFPIDAEPTLTTPDPLDYVIPHRPETLRCADENHAATKAPRTAEKQGEGRDTLTPDQ